MTDNIKIGVLSIQGDIEENIQACKEALNETGITGEVIEVKNYEEILDVDGLIIPGGESTVISIMMSLNQSNWEKLKQKISEGLPVLGTCAGMIILAKKVLDKTIGETQQKLLKSLDVTIERNAFGRQHESFETDLNIPIIGERPFKSYSSEGQLLKKLARTCKFYQNIMTKLWQFSKTTSSEHLFIQSWQKTTGFIPILLE